MADRPTSVAKSVEGLHQDQLALDRIASLREQFVRAQNDNQQQKESQGEKLAEGSQMVRQDAPVLRPTPSGPMRQVPDRQASIAKLNDEHDKADAKIELARKAMEELRARQDRPHDLDRDR